MFQFPACPPLPRSGDGSLHPPGCPIRRSVDHSALAAPHSVSSLGTSFLGVAPQGIHQTPCLACDPIRLAPGFGSPPGLGARLRGFRPQARTAPPLFLGKRGRPTRAGEEPSEAKSVEAGRKAEPAGRGSGFGAWKQAGPARTLLMPIHPSFCCICCFAMRLEKF